MQQTLTVETVQRLTDKEAKEEIKELVLDFKNTGRKSMNILDLLELGIPAQQIERIMKQLVKEKLVSEEDD